MKLIPLTLTLFDKVTNNTYQGTVLLRNTNNDNIAQNVTNATIAGLKDKDDYDSQGAGLFIIIVIAVYALSIVLFIASFITKKASASESVNDESTVTTYLHKMGDLKEKTARDHFKKLKMVMISKVEADSQKQKRGRLGSKGAKELVSISRSSSPRASVADSRITLDRPKSSSGIEPIPSTGLLPKDDARQPLLGTDTCDSPPAARDTLSPNSELRNQGRLSPSVRRASSPCTLSIIREQDSELVDESDSAKKRSSFPSLKRKAGLSIDSVREHSLEEALAAACSPMMLTTDESEDEDAGDQRNLNEQIRTVSDTEIARTVRYAGAPTGLSSTHSVQREYEPNPLPKQFTQIPRPGNQIQRPRPRHPQSPLGSNENVWEEMPHKLLPPPKIRTSRNTKNLHVNIPTSISTPDASDIWVLRNKKRQPTGAKSSGNINYTKEQVPVVLRKSPKTQRPKSMDGSQLRRDRSLRDRSPHGGTHPEQCSPYLTPKESSNLPRPFRSPSPGPRSPTGLSQSMRAAPVSSVRIAPTAGVKITLDRSPDQYTTRTEEHGLANPGYDRSPRTGQPRLDGGGRGRTPPRFIFSDNPPQLSLPQPQFPVTFNSPKLTTRREESV